MQGKFRRLSVFLVATLIIVGSVSVLTPKASGQQTYLLTLTSRVESQSCVNVGTVTIGAGAPPSQLPITKALPLDTPIQMTANPPPGCSFVKWEILYDMIHIEDPNAQTTIFRVTNDAKVGVVFRGGGCCGSVGGVAKPTNLLTILAPYLAVIGLVATTAAVYVKKRRN